MKFQPTWKHTLYNLRGALKVVIPLSIAELIFAMLNAHERDKAITKAYAAGLWADDLGTEDSESEEKSKEV